MARERNPKHSSERSESHKSNPVQGGNVPKYGKPQGQQGQGLPTNQPTKQEISQPAEHGASHGKCDKSSCR